jgi:hypothetical protein
MGARLAFWRPAGFDVDIRAASCFYGRESPRWPPRSAAGRCRSISPEAQASLLLFYGQLDNYDLLRGAMAVQQKLSPRRISAWRFREALARPSSAKADTHFRIHASKVAWRNCPVPAML